jgi:nitric oxide reductase subunit C
MNGRAIAVLFMIAVFLTACGGGAQQAGGAGDPASGDKLFHQAKIGALPGCATCHSTEPGKVIVGPSLAGIATDAAQTPSEEAYEGTAKDAAGFLRESILNPDVDVPEDFQANVMPKTYQAELTDRQLNDLVAYLLTLK